MSKRDGDGRARHRRPQPPYFTGQRENMDLGLYYYNARYYAPYLNRFLSADTLVPDPQNPQSLNRYACVLNRPLNFSDPTGHRECGIDRKQSIFILAKENSSPTCRLIWQPNAKEIGDLPQFIVWVEIMPQPDR
ncbi:MAG TPA: RHS repeat-associated core domain-containing protein [Anaerolineae bacterium]|nr:RHS repeat-associated core domain-containing protein [Anaerolineae bacterium]